MDSKENNDFKLALAETLQKGFNTVVLIGFYLCKQKSYINIATYVTPSLLMSFAWKEAGWNFLGLKLCSTF